jgi:hypothetical protein
MKYVLEKNALFTEFGVVGYVPELTVVQYCTYKVSPDTEPHGKASRKIRILSHKSYIITLFIGIYSIQ